MTLAMTIRQPAAGVDARLVAGRVLRIRALEESLDRLFERGAISGTYHRCIGQEATAVGVTYLLDRERDFVVSNHRNHGHYLGFTDDYAGLMAELRGEPEGVSGGRGGSQVIHGHRFLSNGILGSTIPVATGIALALKRDGHGGIAVCFMGDGALGEGVVYEAFNMAALWKLPVLYVLEQNGMAQSAASETILAGSIMGRFAAFGISAAEITSTDPFEVIEATRPVLAGLREGSGPAALIVNAPRLCAHSKGDDPRSGQELDALRSGDPVRLLADWVTDFAEVEQQARAEIAELAEGVG
ncbi:MAG TPA: thiamine pyrophosphate-dependent dehydrogenase E1 component subunit alpha [Gemmatimonadales bacterium]|nr:thiamine pyrophosphate-dependent dehydrogenase E1 component subunit alpha [Gemmatimonadales bacterium]